MVRPGHPQRDRPRLRELRAAPPVVARGRRGLGGQVPHPVDRVHVDPSPAGRRPAVRVARLDPQPGDRRAGGLLRRRVLPQQHLLAEGARPADGRALSPALRALPARPRRPGDRRARRTGVHARRLAGGDQDVPPILRPRPGLRRRAEPRGLHGPDPAGRREPAAGDRPDAGVPRRRRRLSAPDVPRRPCRPAARGGPRPDRDAGRARGPGPAPGVRDRPSGGRPRRAGPPARRCGGRQQARRRIPRRNPSRHERERAAVPGRRQRRARPSRRRRACWPTGSRPRPSGISGTRASSPPSRSSSSASTRTSWSTTC